MRTECALATGDNDAATAFTPAADASPKAASYALGDSSALDEALLRHSEFRYREVSK